MITYMKKGVMNMTTSVKTTITISLILSFCFGILLQFAYELSNYNRVVGLFSPINESIWEHLKLLFFPFLLFTIILYFVRKGNSQNILFANAYSITIGMLLAIILQYTIAGAFGIHSLFAELAILVLCNIATYILCGYFIKNNKYTINNLYGFVFFIVLFLLFLVFSFRPPRIPLFQDSNTKSFGIIHQ